MRELFDSSLKVNHTMHQIVRRGNAWQQICLFLHVCSFLFHGYSPSCHRAISVRIDYLVHLYPFGIGGVPREARVPLVHDGGEDGVTAEGRAIDGLGGRVGG